MSELAQKASCAQVSTRLSQVVGVTRMRPCQPVTSPAITTATTPETCR